MANITTRSIGTTAVNRPLTYAEFDANFININAAINTNASSSYSRTSIVASEGQTTFTATYIVGYVTVYVNGVFLNPEDYTAVDGTTITLVQSVAANSIVEVFSFSTGADLGIGTGSQNIDGGVPDTSYIGIITKITGGIPASALLESGIPVNTALPTMTGTAAVGQTLSVSTGTWTGTPSYSYQWQKNTGTGYANINGATSSTYTIVTNDQGSVIRCIVNATNNIGTISAITQNRITASTYIFGTIPVSIDEGSTGTFNINTTNIPDGTTLYWTINTTNAITSADFNAISGSFIITENTGIFTVSPTADTLTESAETFTVSIRTGSISGAILVTSNSVTINDTSLSPPTYAFGTIPTSINEGTSGTFNVNTTSVPDGTTLYWRINNITTSTTTGSEDFTSVDPAFTITSNTGSFTVPVKADALTEGAETFTVSIGTALTFIFGSTPAPVATSASVTINDTSLTPPAIRVIFGFGTTTPQVNRREISLFSNTGTYVSESNTNGTARFSVAAAGYGGNKVIFGFGYSSSPNTYRQTISYFSNTGVYAGENTPAGTARAELAAATYGGDKAIFGFGRDGSGDYNRTSLFDNTGTYVSESDNAGQVRRQLAAASYGNDKVIFGYGLVAPSTYVSTRNLFDNTGTYVSETTSAAGTARNGLAAASYGGDKVVFGYGTTSTLNAGNTNTTSLFSNTGSYVSENTAAGGQARTFLAAAGYGGDKVIFGYGSNISTGTAYNRVNLFSNTAAYVSETNSVGTARFNLGAASYSTT